MNRRKFLLRSAAVAVGGSAAIAGYGLIEAGWPFRNGYTHGETGVSIRDFAIGDADGGAVWIKQRVFIRRCFRRIRKT